MLDHYELTEAQKQIWYNEQIYPATSINNIGGYVRIKGNICFLRLQQALQTFIKNHQGIRLCLKKHENFPALSIVNEQPTSFPLIDFHLYQDPEIMFQKWLQEEFIKPFHLYDQPLFYFAFFKIQNADCGYLIKLHHLIADLFSVSLLTEQIKELYEANSSTSLKVKESDFLDYLKEEKEYLQSNKRERDRIFWLNHLDSLPTVKAIKEHYNSKSKRFDIDLDLILTNNIKEFLKLENVSLNVVFNAVVAIYFYLKTANTHQIIGLPLFNRRNSKQKEMFGMFVNTMPFHIEIDPLSSIRNFCLMIKHNLMKSYGHYRYPYHLLVQDFHQKNIDLRSFMNVSVNVYHIQHPRTLDGFEVQNEEFAKNHQSFPLHLIVHEWEEKGIQLQFEYQEACYQAYEVQTLANDIRQMIEDMMECPHQRIESITLNSHHPQIYQQLPYLNFNQVRPLTHQTVIDFFENWAFKQPNKLALQDAHTNLTFGELKSQVDFLTSFIQSYIQGEGIAVLGKPSIECVISILAILKAGRFYIPIDPRETAHRLNEIIQETCAQALFIWDDLHFNTQSLSCRIIDLRDLLKKNRETFPLVFSLAKPEKIAYVIYTSGSTGKPKGVQISHFNLMSYLNWAQIYLDHEHCVFAFYSTISFDLTITSIFLPLINGCKIKIFHSTKGYTLTQILKDLEVTLLKATPSHLNLIEDQSFRNCSLRSLIVGGEDFKVELARRIQKECGSQLSIYNEYGPTETTVGCMIHRFQINQDKGISVPIGQAAGHTHLLVLNEAQQIVSPGEKGELYIGGDQVFAGYFNQPQLTSSSLCHIAGYEKLFYKTGDIVSQCDKNALMYHGRIDEQIKLNGYRIELGEIQSCLSEYPGIAKVCVVPITYQSQICLGAFFIATHQIDIEEMKQFLIQRLPHYKNPSVILPIDHIPLTPNGKLNKDTLQSLVDKYSENSKEHLSEKLVETKILETIRTQLKRDTLQLEDHYFQIGGDSITAIQIASKLASKGICIGVKEILSAKSIKEICRAACQLQVIQNVKSLSQGIQPLTPVMEWFFQQNFPYPHFYHNSVLLKLQNQIRVDQIEECLNFLFHSHDAFRLNYHFADRVLFYNDELKNKKIKVETYDLTEMNEIASQEYIEKIAIKYKQSTNIENGYLLSAAVIFLNSHQICLLVCIHHLCIDGLSWQIFLQDLNQLMHACMVQNPFKLTNRTTSFQDWVKDQISSQSWAENIELQDYFSRIPRHISFETIEKGTVEQYKFSLSEDKTHRFLEVAKMYSKISGLHLLLMAFLLTLRKLLCRNDFLVIVEHHGRLSKNPKIDLTKTIGWLTVMCPLYFNVKDDFMELLNHVKYILAMLDRNLSHLTFQNPWIHQYPSPYRFNYLGPLEHQYSEFEVEDIALGLDSHPDNHRFLIDFNAYLMQNKLSHILVMPTNGGFSADLFIETYHNELEMIMTRDLSEIAYMHSLDTVQLDLDELKDLMT